MKIAFLGAGAMGEALMRGLIDAETVAASDIIAYDVAASRQELLRESLGVGTASIPADAVRDAQVVLLAVKPQMIAAALEPLRSNLTPEQTVISIAAGISTGIIEACLDNAVPVVRVMPNTPALVGAAASAICGGKYASEEHLALALHLFSAVGLAVQTDEKLMDAVTGLSGSGPAYVYLFIEALSDGGVKMGLPRSVATQLAAQTVAGAARMVLETGMHPGALKDQVTSPGGTTIAALHALENGAFRGTVMDAVEASAERSRELG
jgi:pyrroline-5-carboxylate reductase